MVTRRIKLVARAAVLTRFTGIAPFAPLKVAPWKRAISVAINVLVSPVIKLIIFRYRKARKIFYVPSLVGKSWAQRSLSKPKKNFFPAIFAAQNFSAEPENAASAEQSRDEIIFVIF